MLVPFLHKHLPGTQPVTCRHCGSQNVRLSTRRKSDSKRFIYRCRACGKHFKAGVDVAARLPRIIMLLVVLIFITGTTMAFLYSDLNLDSVPEPVSDSTVKKPDPIKSHL